MPAVTNEQSNSKTFLNIVSGRITQEVAPETPGATKRTNKTGREVFEITHQAWKGIVRDWRIDEFESAGKKIKNLKVIFDDANLSLSGSMMREFIKKFAGANKHKEVTISSYPDFIGKDGKPKKAGLTMLQEGERIYSYFDDYKDGSFTQKNGFPVAPAKWSEMTDEQKAIYNIQVNSFLEAYVTLNPVNTIGDNPIDDIPTITPEDEQPPF